MPSSNQMSRKKKVMNFLENFDFYAAPIQLTYKGNTKITSKLGIAISLIVFILILVMFGYLLN